MNPLMFVNWRTVADAFNAVCWLAAVLLVGYVLVMATTPQDVAPHTARHVIVGR